MWGSDAIHLDLHFCGSTNFEREVVSTKNVLDRTAHLGILRTHTAEQLLVDECVFKLRCRPGLQSGNSHTARHEEGVVRGDAGNSFNLAWTETWISFLRGGFTWGVEPPWIRFPWAVPAIITYLSTVQALSPSATRVCSCFAHGSMTRWPTRRSVEGIMLLPRRGTSVPEPAVLTAAVALFALAPLAATTMACRVLFTTKRASRRKAWHTVSSEVVRMVRLPANRSPRNCTAFTNWSTIFPFRDFSPRLAKARLAGMT